MRQIRIGWVMACVLVATLGMTACGPSQEEQMAAESQEKFDQLAQMQADLQAKRDEFRMASEKAAMAMEEEGGEEAEGGEDAGADLAALDGELETMTTDFITAIVEFINSDPPIEGEPLNERQQAAITMKSSEDMILAKEYIDKGGDYRRAIRIYNDALSVDPDNADLKAALASAEESRFVSPEKFAEVKKGMSQEDVRGVLGQVNLRNIREYPRDVVAWFYPTADDGAAAGVFFRKRGETYTAYDLKYEAVPGGPLEAD